MNSESLVIDLVHLVKEKKALMSNLLELTITQGKLILEDEDDISRIQVVIDEKQKLMKVIDNIDFEFLDKLDELKRLLNIKTLDSLKEEPVKGFRELKQEIQDIIKLTEELKQLDEANTQKAKANLDKVKEQLKVINVGKKASNSYSTNKYQQGQSILIDKKK